MITRFFHRREWALLVLGIVLILCQVFLDFKIPEYMEHITSSFLKDDVDLVAECGTEMILCAVLSLVVSLAVGFVLSNMAASVGRNIRQEQFDKVQSLAMQDINRLSAASLVTRSTNDVYQVQNFLARGTTVVTKAPIITVWAFCKVYDKNVDWIMLIAAGMAAIFLVMAVTLYLATPLFKRIQWFTDGVNRATRESLDGIRVIRAYNAEEYQEGRFNESSDRLLNNNLASTRIMMYSFPTAFAVNNFVTLAIYWVGAGLIMSAGSTDEAYDLFTDMIVITSYSTMAITSFLQMLGIFRMLPRAMVGIKRIEEVVDTVPSITGGTETSSVEGHEGEVEFRHVSFSYPGSERKVLDDISFKVGRGKTFAIIGSVGSGKTSLVNLLARFYDVSEGEVLVGGRDVRDYRTRDLHLKLGYVPQNAIIFSGPVSMNVNYGYGSADRTEEDIRRALRIAQADFVDGMPEGLDSHVSQHGRNISGGQKQRISIARAVCRSPDIYIFDDTFSALDYKTDKSLRRAIRRETEGSTVILVAQRIGTIMDADEILVLDEGRIAGRGTHYELMRTCQVYRDIARSQLSEEELS